MSYLRFLLVCHYKHPKWSNRVQSATRLPQALLRLSAKDMQTSHPAIPNHLPWMLARARGTGNSASLCTSQRDNLHHTLLYIIKQAANSEYAAHGEDIPTGGPYRSASTEFLKDPLTQSPNRRILQWRWDCKVACHPWKEKMPFRCAIAKESCDRGPILVTGE